MSEYEVVDVREFKIKNLERMVHERDAEIQELERRLNATRFAVDLAFNWLKSRVWGSSLFSHESAFRIAKKGIVLAIKGDQEIPLLRVDHGHV
jgi:predicted RNase H-like nuclease (RuvC/YqgF family)